MATSKSGAKSRTAKKPTTTKSTRSTTTTKATVKTVATPKRSLFKKASGEPNYPAIMLAEIVGTFVLTLVALLTLQETAALYVGVTLAVLVLAVGVVSGAHVNPAVTFGLWAARKLRTSLVPVYWLAQFVGAILAILLLGAFSGSGYPLDFSNFTHVNWGILAVEAVGTGIFLFGVVAAISNDKLSSTGKAFGVGLSLTIGILVSSAVFDQLQAGKFNAYQTKASASQTEKPATPPAELSIKGATLNPAVALASTEYTETQLAQRLSQYGVYFQTTAKGNEAPRSRLGLETILGTLIGAAIGANLYLLLAYANRQQN